MPCDDDDCPCCEEAAEWKAEAERQAQLNQEFLNAAKLYESQLQQLRRLANMEGRDG